MTESLRRTVSFTGSRAGDYPCTWGQRDVWREVESLGNPAHGNLAGGGFLPRGVTPDEVLAAIAALMCRYESLRSQFFLTADGQLRQRVLDAGEFAVEFEEINPDPTVVISRWAADVQAEPYDLANDVPFRARIGLVDGEPRLIIFGMPHMAADFLSTRVFFDELLRWLEGRSAAEPVGTQPVEKAEQELSPQGQRTLRRSLDYWRWATDVTPPAAFDTSVAVPEKPRYQRGLLTSRAIPEALDTLAARHQVGTSHVLLAAMATLLGRYTGLPSCLVRVVVGNRGKPELRNAMGTLTQEVVAVVELDPARFAEMVRAAWSASLQAMRHGQYDPDPVAEIVSGAGAELDVYFNDMWTATRGGKGAPGQADGTSSSRENVETTFGWGRSNDWANVAFFLESAAVIEDEAAIELSLLADTACIPIPTIRSFLFAMEELLTMLAADDNGGLREIELVHDPRPEAELVATAVS